MVDILMATYNGEKYLDTQITSIINQTYSNWQLLIHDDGSTDNTVGIIKKWANIDSRIKLIDDEVRLHNPGKNFLHLLKYSKSDFICFADQDDYWFENKLEKNLPYFYNINVPLLISSSCFVWRSDINKISDRINFNVAEKLEDFLFLNGGIQGCSMFFNSYLRDIVNNYNNGFVYMHDHLISLVAYCFGTVKFTPDKLFLYRQHSSNASVHLDTNKSEHIATITKNINIPVIYKDAYLGIKGFYDNYRDKLPKKEKNVITTYLSFPAMKSIPRFFKISWSNFTLGTGKHFQLIIKLLIRKYSGDLS